MRENRTWISIEKELPPNKICVEFASHQYYGLANWCDERGFHEVFVTAGPGEEAEYYSDSDVWNGEIMYWRKICSWPNYGCRGHDAETMRKYAKG